MRKLRWNWPVWLGFALSVVAFVSYFRFFARAGAEILLANWPLLVAWTTGEPVAPGLLRTLPISAIWGV